MVSNVIYCEFEKVGNACRNQLKYKDEKEVCGPDRALFEKGLRPSILCHHGVPSLSGSSPV